MGKSYRNRHTDEVFVKLAGKSDKTSKQNANRKFRRRESSMSRLLQELDDKEDYHYPRQREVSDTWDFASDGLTVRVKGWFFGDDEDELNNTKKKLRRK